MTERVRKLAASTHAGWRSIKKRVANLPHLETTPRDLRIDDTFLVEFPKSGVTWLTFLLASVNLKMSGIERRPTFFSINDMVPDIHTSRYLPPPLPFPGHRMIKSHATYNPLYAKVLYLVRDPRDVLPSYHAFMIKLGWYRGSLSDLVRDKRSGIDSWCRHVGGWLSLTRPSVSFNLVRYEDLRADTLQTLRIIYRLLGFTIDDETLKEAIAAASLDAMRADEAFYAQRNLSLPQDFAFVRKGGSEHREELAPDDLAYITKRAGSLMERLEYSREL